MVFIIFSFLVVAVVLIIAAFAAPFMVGQPRDPWTPGIVVVSMATQFIIAGMLIYAALNIGGA